MGDFRYARKAPDGNEIEIQIPASMFEKSGLIFSIASAALGIKGIDLDEKKGNKPSIKEKAACSIGGFGLTSVGLIGLQAILNAAKKE